MIRVLVVDENEIFRRGVVACLREDDTMEVVEDSKGGQVDVAVVSARAAQELERECPLVICANVPLPAPCEGKHVLAALPRSTLTHDQLLAAVRGAAAGLVVSRHGVWQPDLDERRLGILRLLAEGADTREISQSLQYSTSTIKGLIASIESELGSRNRTHAVATAIRRGLI
jgi:DNA-binding NarL/FixJ family response regulator